MIYTGFSDKVRTDNFVQILSNFRETTKMRYYAGTKKPSQPIFVLQNLVCPLKTTTTKKHIFITQTKINAISPSRCDQTATKACMS